MQQEELDNLKAANQTNSFLSPLTLFCGYSTFFLVCHRKFPPNYVSLRACVNVNETDENILICFAKTCEDLKIRVVSGF